LPHWDCHGSPREKQEQPAQQDQSAEHEKADRKHSVIEGPTPTRTGRGDNVSLAAAGEGIPYLFYLR